MLPIIIKRELTTMLRTKAQIVSFIVMIVLILAAGVAGRFLAPTLTGEEESTETTNVSVVLTSETKVLEPSVSKLFGLATSIKDLDPQSLTSDEYANSILITGPLSQPTAYVNDAPTDLARTVTQNSLQAYLLEKAGMPSADIQKVQVAVNSVNVESVSSDGFMSTLDETNPSNAIMGMVTVFLILLVSIMGISTLSQGIVEEKSSRVVEILLSSVRPQTLLLGKILGIGIGLFIQFVLYIAAMVAAVLISGLPIFDALSHVNLGWFAAAAVLWLLIGYFTHATLTGGVAATVSRQEDLGGVLTPVMFASIIPFYVATYLVPSLPDALVTRVLSVLPIFAPYMMPMRMGLGMAAWWEVLLALVLSIVAIPLLGMLAGKIYERSILRTGERVKILQLFRS